MNVCLGLDIGSHYIKMVEGYARKGKFFIKTAGIIRNPLPHTHINLNENSQKQFSGFLKEFLKTIGIKKKETVCVISGNGLIIHYFDIPDIPPEEIKSAVELEVLQVIPGGVEKIEYDYTVLPSRSGKRTVMLVGLPKPRCDFFVNTLLMSGLRPVIMDVGGLALVNCYKTLSNNSYKGVAIIDVGASHTVLAIVEKDGFVFIRDIDFGGDNINSEISKLKKISVSEAEQFKKNPDFQQDVEKILKSAATDALQEILTSINYFETRTQEKIEKFLLTGGSSLLPGFVKIVEENLGIPGDIWKPMEGLYQYCKTDQPRYLEVCFSQTLGLVARKLI
ncbi:MAG: pilus assembly protein PilM [Candidatus Ratteibacteria bacterium]